MSFFNLISNGVEFAQKRPGGRLYVEFAETPEYTKLFSAIQALAYRASICIRSSTRSSRTIR